MRQCMCISAHHVASAWMCVCVFRCLSLCLSVSLLNSVSFKICMVPIIDEKNMFYVFYKSLKNMFFMFFYFFYVFFVLF